MSGRAGRWGCGRKGEGRGGVGGVRAVRFCDTHVLFNYIFVAGIMASSLYGACAVLGYVTFMIENSCTHLSGA